MGFQLKFQFYDFDLGMSFRANIGNYVYNDVKAANLQMLTRENFNKNNYFSGLLTECFNTYYVDNMRSDQIYADEAGTILFDKWFATDYFVEKASFLRCDNITLGWSFQRPTLNGRVFCTVSNPFVISGYSGLDPEVFGGIDNNLYPRSMTTVLGVNLQF
jgi:iron complex outermembrane receptor protein